MWPPEPAAGGVITHPTASRRPMIGTKRTGTGKYAGMSARMSSNARLNERSCCPRPAVGALRYTLRDSNETDIACLLQLPE